MFNSELIRPNKIQENTQVETGLDMKIKESVRQLIESHFGSPELFEVVFKELDEIDAALSSEGYRSDIPSEMEEKIRAMAVKIMYPDHFYKAEKKQEGNVKFTEIDEDERDIQLKFKKSYTKGKRSGPMMTYLSFKDDETGQFGSSSILGSQKHLEQHRKLQGGIAGDKRQENIFFENIDVLEDRLFKMFELKLYLKNAVHFKEDVKAITGDITQEQSKGGAVFMDSKQRDAAILTKLQGKYSALTMEQLKELLDLAGIEDISKVELHQIHQYKKIFEIFQKYIKGWQEKTAFTGVSVGLSLGAMVSSFAPEYIALISDPKSSGKEINLLMFVLLSLGGLFLSTGCHEKLKEIISRNFTSEGGLFDEMTEKIMRNKNISSMEPSYLQNVLEGAKEGYSALLQIIVMDAMPSIISLVTAFAVLACKDLRLASGTVLLGGFMVMASQWFNKKFDFWGRESKARQDEVEVQGKFRTILDSWVELKMMGSEDQAKEELTNLLKQGHISQQQAGQLRGLSRLFNGAMNTTNMSLAGLITVMGGLDQDLVRALIYSPRFSQALGDMLGVNANILRQYYDVVLLESLLNKADTGEIPENNRNLVGMDDVDTSKFILKLEDLSYEVGGNKILKGINLEIRHGDLIYVKGKSGSGKSTLLKLIGGGVEPTEGDVFCGQKDGKDVPMDKIKRNGHGSLANGMALVSQSPYLFPGSWRKNLLFGIPEDTINSIEPVGLQQIIKDVLIELDLLDRVSKDQKGELALDDRGSIKIGGRSASFSGGEQARIGIARMLIKMKLQKNPPVSLIIVDEPTAGLSEEVKEEVANIFNRLMKDNPELAVVVVSHDKKTFVDYLGNDPSDPKKKQREMQIVAMEKGEIKK